MPPNVFKLQESGDVFTFKGGKPFLLQLGSLASQVPGANFADKLGGIKGLLSQRGIQYDKLPTLSVEDAVQRFIPGAHPNAFFDFAQTASLEDIAPGGEAIKTLTPQESGQALQTRLEQKRIQEAGFVPTRTSPEAPQSPLGGIPPQTGTLPQPRVQGGQITQARELLKRGDILGQKAAQKTGMPFQPVSSQEAPQIAPTTPSAEFTPTPTTSPEQTFNNLFQQAGIPNLGTNKIEDIIKSVSTVFKLDEITKEMEKIDESHLETIQGINENPWISEGLRSKKVAAATEKYENKKKAVVERLKLQGDIVGKAIDIFQKERELQKDLLFKQLDLRAKEIESLEPKGETERAFFRQFGRLPTASELLQYRPSVSLQTGAIDRRLTPSEAADFGVPFGTMASEVEGIIPLGTAERKAITSKSSALATLNQIELISQKVNTFGPGFLGLNRLLQGGQLGLGALTQQNPDAAQLIAQRGILATIIRGLGETGTLATQDVERALALIPGLTTTKEVARKNLQEIKTILESAREAVISGAQFQLRSGQKAGGFSGVSPSGLKYKLK